MSTTASQNTDFEKASPGWGAYLFYAGGVLLAAVCAAILIGACAARAQTAPAADPSGVAAPVAAPAASSADNAPASASPAPAAPTNAAPRYSTRDVERAFGFIDANKDGKISREEASGFRNVAKYFDAADVNKDGALSLEEFSSALNRP
jgi:hypothetical protein